MWWTRQILPAKNFVITNSSISSIQMKIWFVRDSWDFRWLFYIDCQIVAIFHHSFYAVFSLFLPNSYLLTSKFLSIILYVIKIFDEFSSHTNSVCVVNPSGWNDWTISYIFLRFLQYTKNPYIEIMRTVHKRCEANEWASKFDNKPHDLFALHTHIHPAERVVCMRSDT